MLPSAIGFAFDGSIDWVAAAALAVGAITGAALGARALQAIPVTAVAYGFATVLAVSALQLVVDAPGPATPAQWHALALVGLVGIGLMAGTLAGLLGVGGGVVILPAPVIFFGVSSAVAKGTSLAVIIPASLVATRQNLRTKSIDLPLAAAAGSAGAAAAYGAAPGLDQPRRAHVERAVRSPSGRRRRPHGREDLVELSPRAALPLRSAGDSTPK